MGALNQALGQRVTLIGDSDTSINQFHHASIVLRVTGGAAGNQLSSLKFAGVEVLGSTVTWATNNNATAGSLAAAINKNGWVGVAIDADTTNFLLAIGPPGGTPPINGPNAGRWDQGGPVVTGTGTGTFTVSVYEGNGERGWWSWFQALTRHYFQTVDNIAISGHRLVDNIANVKALGIDSDLAVVHVGINDIAYGGRSASDVFAEWQTLIKEIRKYDPAILAIGLPPGIPPTFQNAVNASQVQKFNRLLFDYVRNDRTGRIDFVPLGTEILNPASANGNLLAGFIGNDLIHTNTLGGYSLGRDLKNAIGNLLPANRFLAMSVVDNPVISASAAGVLASGVGLFINAPVTNLAGGWTGTTVGGTTAFVAPAQRTYALDGDNFGKNQGIDHLNSGTGADFFSISTASFSPNLAVGDAVYGEMDVKYAITSGVGVRTIQLALLITTPPLIHIMHDLGSWTNFFGSGADLVALPEGFVATLRTPVIEPLVVAPTAATLQLQMWAHNAAGQSVVTAARAGAYKV